MCPPRIWPPAQPVAVGTKPPKRQFGIKFAHCPARRCLVDEWLFVMMTGLIAFLLMAPPVFA